MMNLNGYNSVVMSLKRIILHNLSLFLKNTSQFVILCVLTFGSVADEIFLPTFSVVKIMFRGLRSPGGGMHSLSTLECSF